MSIHPRSIYQLLDLIENELTKVKIHKEKNECTILLFFLIILRAIQVGCFSLSFNVIQKLVVTFVEGDPKALFSIATTPRYWGKRSPFSGIAPLYRSSLPYNAECLARSDQVSFFESLVWLDQGLNLLSQAIDEHSNYYDNNEELGSV